MDVKFGLSHYIQTLPTVKMRCEFLKVLNIKNKLFRI